MTDEKKFTGWKKTYIGLLNAATVICIILGLFIHVGGWIGSDLIKGFMGIGRTISSEERTATSREQSLGSFDKIEGTVAIGNVVFEYGDDYGVSYENYPEGEVPNMKLSGSTLKIEQKASNRWGVKDIKSRFSGAKVTVTVPKGTAVEVDLTLNMGAVEAEDITLGKVKLDADMGAITMKNVTARKLDLNADMGAITLEKTTFEDGNMKAAMGGISLEDVTFDDCELKADMGGITVQGSFSDLEADCDMGGIDVQYDNDDCELDLNADMGGVTVNGESVGRKYHR